MMNLYLFSFVFVHSNFFDLYNFDTIKNWQIQTSHRAPPPQKKKKKERKKIGGTETFFLNHLEVICQYAVPPPLNTLLRISYN